MSKKKGNIKNEIELAVKKIFTTEYLINEEVSITGDKDNITVDIQNVTKFNLNDNSVSITINVNCSNTDNNLVFAKISVCTIFLVKNLKDFSIEGDSKDLDFNLPTEFYYTILNISLSHTRAIFSQQISNSTKFNNFILPLFRKDWIEDRLIKPLNK